MKRRKICTNRIALLWHKTRWLHPHTNWRRRGRACPCPVSISRIPCRSGLLASPLVRYCTFECQLVSDSRLLPSGLYRRPWNSPRSCYICNKSSSRAIPPIRNWEITLPSPCPEDRTLFYFSSEYYSIKKGDRWGSNPQPLEPQSRALPD